MTFSGALALATFTSCVGVTISMGEKLAVFAMYGDKGLLSWNIARLRHVRLFKGTAGRILGWLYQPMRHRALMILTLVASLTSAIMAAATHPSYSLVGLTLVGFVLLSVRSWYGTDGSDQMTIVVLSGLFVALVVPVELFAASLALIFIAAQLILSYTVSGIAKVASPQWRSGAALGGILSTAGYGNDYLCRIFTRHPRIAWVNAWCVIIFETAFILIAALLTPVPTVLLLIGICFHAAIALIMGLNNFFWAFSSAYPPLLYCMTLAHSYLYLQ